MGMTTAETISNTLRFYLNIGSDTVATDQNLRERARFFLILLLKDVWDEAPFWFRLKVGGTVSLVANDSFGTMPSDFSHEGEEMKVYIQNYPDQPLQWIAPDQMQALRRTTNSTTGRPMQYTLQDRTVAGRPKIQIWPSANTTYTLLVDNYVKLMPDLVDRPVAPIAEVGAAVGLTGAYSYLVTFVTASGETEAGIASNTITLANQKGNVTSIPVSPCHSVTSRKLYRTSAGGSTYGLVTTIADNTTTSYLGDVLVDGSLGVAPPTTVTAITGTEQFPEDAQERLFMGGLRTALATSQGDVRDLRWREEWMKDVKRFWGNYKQGRSEPMAMPTYGTTRNLTYGDPRYRFSV
jgi:hypothetical protein